MSGVTYLIYFSSHVYGYVAYNTFYRAIAKVYDRSSSDVADEIFGNLYSIHLRHEVSHDDRVCLVYFDEKWTSISNVIVIFHVSFGATLLALKGK